MQQNLHPDKRATAVRDFYETHGAAFAATRQAPWGIFGLVKKALKPGDTLIDVGAGNARLASILPDDVRYIGIEPSSTLRQAAQLFVASRLNTDMRDGGFTVSNPVRSLPVRDAEADIVACFAVLHHIPTRRAREQAVAELARILKPGGTAIVTVWNLRSARFAQFKIWLASWLRLPMIVGGEAGDVWVPWKANGENALRYVHAFTPQEFRSLFDERLWKIQRCEAWGNDAPTSIFKARNLVIVAERKLDMKKQIFKSDKYKKVRGGYSRLLEVVCAKCGTRVCLYQKDGPGLLKRMYLDRMIGSIVGINMKNASLKSLSQLVCRGCKELLGIPMIYKKEQRFAYRLFVGSVSKKDYELT